MEKKIDISGVEPGLLAKKVKGIKESVVFKGKKIAISVSENEDLELLGFTNQHLNDVSIEIARYITANGATAMYGGDLRVGGFTYFFSELSNQYQRESDKSHRFVNYFVFPNTKAITPEVRIEFHQKKIEIKEVKSPPSIEVEEERDYYPWISIEDRYVYCECFKEMRLQMAKDSDARILVGGKVSKFLGYIPGVIEEALLTLKEDKPVFLVGGFGGATAKLISLLKGDKVHELSNNYQYVGKFLEKYQDFVADKCSYANYENLKSELLFYNIDALSKLNGLTMDENEILFTSKNIHEIVFYIMKGLKKL
ncbi:hypothetical protein [Parapedobacter koreensis]|uniref:Uncharacterized protein n=1 Tax=Parapedobacter koreensis TaxID=332977 RepID=A0A1H7SEE9_9SPHI|nr:hypothetical protein [Parapedobacter koreensis]SEL70104.1 hypothetical protein SAMN05421740_108214 [Parapedobacter koreensis]